MIVPYSWLQDFFKVLPSVEDLQSLLLKAGLEVEGVTVIHPSFKGVITGRILSWNIHPSDPRLHLALVDIGRSDPLSIVCGAKNLFPGAIVPVALPGAKLGEREIGIKEFQGEKSMGMLCSREELGLEQELLPEGEGGIAILPEGTPLGEDLGLLLELPDKLLEVKVTPNRPDWYSMLGLAREISVFTGEPFNFLEFSGNFSPDPASSFFDLDILDPDLCYLYLASVIFNVKIQESPLWLKSRLVKCGIRPINNVVDATNYVMLLTGQPLHAFDYENIAQKKIVVRRARPGETLTTLDGKERALEGEMLLIADPEKAIGIAGVMGGENSEVKQETTRVVLESAYFAPFSIRRTAKKLGLRTEASLRFERGTNQEQVELGSKLATQLISQLSGGQILKGEIRKGVVGKPPPVRISPERVNFYLESHYSREKIIADLKRLYFIVNDLGEELEVESPPFRNDVKEDADLIEDIARLNGYENIPSSLPRGEPRKGFQPLWRARYRELRWNFLNYGLQEVLTAPLVSPSLNRFRFLFPEGNEVKILNPISQDRSVLRVSLLPSLISTFALNERVGKEPFGFFELGKVYHFRGENELPNELRVLGFLLSQRKSRSWRGEEQTFDFFSLKGLIEVSFREFPLEFLPGSCPFLHPGKQAEIFLGGQKVGIIGELSPEVLSFWDLKSPACGGEILFDSFLKKPQTPSFKPFPRYPSVRRDIAVVLDDGVPYLLVEGIIREAGGEFLEAVEFFDFYQGPNIPPGKKSLAFSLIFRHPQRTLLDSEVNQFMEKVEGELSSKLEAELRKG
ncbi:MAG: phenylalanine--tRNA ligase subunit beta [Caldiserica bacterium]|jgi:phenylalanyl-tRNA synthetase beta chain|nr:phenylalanine--tRNA ligase subunit beta [Caldisericota bacterium]MDH7562632.1 phenylalanine--tRNA ligase subunit beta [Caldisericota bacterium]